MTPLNPYIHTCHIPMGAGHDPKECPACRWVEINQQQTDANDPTRKYFGALGIRFNPTRSTR